MWDSGCSGETPYLVWISLGVMIDADWSKQGAIYKVQRLESV